MAILDLSIIDWSTLCNLLDYRANEVYDTYFY